MTPNGTAWNGFRRVAAALLLALATSTGWAQQVGQPTDTAAAAAPAETEIRSLIQTLEDDAARKRLVAELDALLAAKARAEAPPRPHFGERVIEFVAERMQRLSVAIATATAAGADFERAAAWLRSQGDQPERRRFWLALLWKVALVIGLGWAAYRLTRLALARPRAAIERRGSEPITLRVLLLLVRTGLDVVPLAAFAAAAYVALPLTEPDRPTRLVALALVNAAVLARGILIVARAAFAPRAAGLRLLDLDDADANYAYHWVGRFANAGAYGFVFADAALLLGLPQAGAHAIRLLVGLVLALLAVVLVLQSREWLAQRIRAGRAGDGRRSAAGPLRGHLADVWHILAVFYVGATFGIWALGIEDGFAYVLRGTVLSVVAVGAALLIVKAADRLIAKGLDIGEEAQRRFPGLQARANRYIAVLNYSVRTVVAILLAIVVLQAWGIDAFGWVASDSGRRVAGSIVTIALLAAGGVVVWELASSAIERRLAGEQDGADLGARARTLLPMVRNALMIVLAVLVVMVALSELGVNIGPLLAGAGIFGLAVGFGAQTLVKDVITGFFILMENQLSVGDVVRTGSHAGLVERLTIRTIRLRDLAGNVHIIPFSEVTTLENMTMEFSRYVFDVGVAYREDTDEVVQVLRQIGAEMEADAYFGDVILQPLEILGVDQFADSAVVIKARITTKPIKQWEVGREFNRRMKRRFDELGIEIPFPHRTLYFGTDKDGEAPPARIRLQPQPTAIEAPAPPDAGGTLPTPAEAESSGRGGQRGTSTTGERAS